MYQIPANASDSDGALAGKVSFYLSNCVVNCTLNIDITNTQANPTAAGQLISGLSFVLKNGSTALTTPGTLSSATSDGAGGGVTVLDSSFHATTTMTLPTSWKIGYGGGSSAGFYLNDLTGGKPANMIIGPGPYTNANSSITVHAPSLAGTVEFSISSITGLTSSTDLSSVDFYYGTGPDAYGALTCTTDCGGPIDMVATTPEPGSLFLACGFFLIFGLARRRFAPAV